MLCFVWGWEVCKSVGRESPSSCPYILTREIQLEWTHWTLLCILMDPPEGQTGDSYKWAKTQGKCGLALPVLFFRSSFFNMHFSKKLNPGEQRKTGMTALAFHSEGNCNSVKISLRNSAEAQTPSCASSHLYQPQSWSHGRNFSNRCISSSVDSKVRKENIYQVWFITASFFHCLLTHFCTAHWDSSMPLFIS